jgi:hypothetical protein
MHVSFREKNMHPYNFLQIEDKYKLFDMQRLSIIICRLRIKFRKKAITMPLGEPIG